MDITADIIITVNIKLMWNYSKGVYLYYKTTVCVCVWQTRRTFSEPTDSWDSTDSVSKSMGLWEPKLTKCSYL